MTDQVETYEDAEFYFASLNTWRVEMFVENWDGAPVMTKQAADMLQIAKRELAARKAN